MQYQYHPVIPTPSFLKSYYIFNKTKTFLVNIYTIPPASRSRQIYPIEFDGARQFDPLKIRSSSNKVTPDSFLS
jgi:hypothetical protein